MLESLDEEEEEVKEVYNSGTEFQSISQILLDTIHSIRSPMEGVVTTETFLDVEGIGKERFEEQYTSFVAGVQQMESYICNYLKVLCMLKACTFLLISKLKKLDLMQYQLKDKTNLMKRRV